MGPRVEFVLKYILLCRLPYCSKSSSDVSVRVNNAGKNTPDLEIIWFPLVIGGFAVKTPPGIYGVTLVRPTVVTLFYQVKLKHLRAEPCGFEA